MGQVDIGKKNKVPLNVLECGGSARRDQGVCGNSDSANWPEKAVKSTCKKSFPGYINTLIAGMYEEILKS